MVARRAERWLPVIALSALLSLPAAGILVGAAGAAPAAGPGALRPASIAAHSDAPGARATGSPSVLATLAARDARILRERGIPSKDVFLPNLAPSTTVSGGAIQPTYAAAPAPMGIGDDGVALVNGTDTGTVSYASSVEGVIHLSALNASYVNGDGVDSISMQLNTVLTHVDLFGNTSNQFWIQNVPTYTVHTEGFSLVDNIWNFSSGAFNLTTNSLYSDNGTAVAPVYYYGLGPAWTLPLPFTVRVYNNASVVNDRPTVYFNYSITAANGTTYSGSYDRVEFNSTGLVPPTHAAPPPTFQIDGQHYGANGFLPNDAEMMIGGWNDGSTQSFTTINATDALYTAANGSHVERPVPEAYNFGFDTGETAEGIAEWASPGVAHLNAGPSILGPLWGLQGAAYGHEDLSVAVHPANAFLFVSPGRRFSPATAAWAPLPASGSVDLQLPTGSYGLQALLSDHAPAFGAATGSKALSFTLRLDPSLGVYTPLWAWGNAQLAAVSEFGNGTIGNPYVLDDNAVAVSPPIMNPLFGEINDFIFPVFAGVFLAYTTAYVEVAHAPSFTVAYSLPEEAHVVSGFGVAATNELELQTLNTSHVSILSTPSISGWQLSGDIGEPLASVVIWNSTQTLIAGNVFQDQGTSVLLFGGGHNTIWGNSFTQSNATASVPSNLLYGTTQVGLLLYGSHDLIYNNYFDVPVPAETPPVDITTFLTAHYHDIWNITPQAASIPHHYNGIRVAGSILNGSTQGGNFWSNYGTASDPYGLLPYDDARQITSGGDLAPLLPYVIYTVTFHATGLPSGTTWSVTLGGVRERSTTGTIVFWGPNGTYAYTVGHVPGLKASPRLGAVSVHGAGRSVGITWY